MVDRKQLDEIIMKNDTNDWWQPEPFLKNTKHLLPPELEILLSPPTEHENYNCFLYIFNLHQNKEILKETKGFIYDNFVKELIRVGELVKTDNPHDGDYAVYQDLQNYPDNLTHIGIVNNGKIISKWAWGPLVKHDLWDVPKDYGDDIFYLQAISKDRATELYSKYKAFNILKQ